MLIISISEQSGKFHYVNWDMTTGLLIIVLGLRHMNHELSLTVSFFSFVQTSFREFGEVGLGTYT